MSPFWAGLGLVVKLVIMDEVKNTEQEVPVEAPVEAPVVETPVVETPAVPADLSGFTSCFKCGRDEGGAVSLIVRGVEKLCGNCVLS